MAATFCKPALVSNLVADETAFYCGSTELSTADLSEDRDTWSRQFSDSTCDFSDKSVPQSPGARETTEPVGTSDWGGVGSRLSRVFNEFDVDDDSGLEDFGSSEDSQNDRIMADYGLSQVFRNFQCKEADDDDDDEEDFLQQDLPPGMEPPPGLTRDAVAAAAAFALLGKTSQRVSVVAVKTNHNNFSCDNTEDTRFDSTDSTCDSQDEESCISSEDSQALLYTRNLGHVFAQQVSLNDAANTAMNVDFAPDPLPHCKPPSYRSFRPPPGLTRDPSTVAAAATTKEASFGDPRTKRPPR